MERFAETDSITTGGRLPEKKASENSLDLFFSSL
jgi:hypothetical protein